MSTLAYNPQLTEQDRIDIRLSALNDAAPETAYSQFLRCCVSSRWAQRMTHARPFANLSELLDFSDGVWLTCSREDWLEAFAGHPRIGQQSANRWSRQEQSGVTAASQQIHLALVKANQQYEEKFGHIFIICASRKTAEEILANLEQRLANGPEIEIHNAVEQQRRIMRERLWKLLSE